MARKKVIDLTADNVVGFGKEPGQKKVGEEVSGYYLGSKKVQTSMGPSTLHVLQIGEGKTLGLWGSAQLNSKLAQIDKGTMVFVTYEKKIKVPKGTMKVFNVEYDDEDTIEVAGSTEINFNPSSEEADSEYDETGEEGDGDPELDADGSEGDADTEELQAEPAEPVRAAPKAAKPAARPAPGTTAVSAASRERAAALLSKKQQ